MSITTKMLSGLTADGFSTDASTTDLWTVTITAAGAAATTWTLTILPGGPGAPTGSVSFVYTVVAGDTTVTIATALWALAQQGSLLGRLPGVLVTNPNPSVIRVFGTAPAYANTVSNVNSGAGTTTVAHTTVGAGQSGNSTFPTNSSGGVLKCQRVKDKSGLFQVATTVGLTGTCFVQGRPMPTAPWFTILTLTQADWSVDANSSAAKVITLFPEMRVGGTITGGASPSMDAWITE